MMKLCSLFLLNLLFPMLMYAQQKAGYYQYEGKLGPREAVLGITIRPSSALEPLEEIAPVSAYYYFKDDLEPVALYKDRHSKGNKIVLTEMVDEHQERFEGVYNEKVFRGKWYWNPSDEGEDVVLYARKQQPDDRMVYFQEHKVVKVPIKGSGHAAEGIMTFSAYLPADSSMAGRLVRRLTKGKSDNFESYAKATIREFEKSYRNQVQEQCNGANIEDTSAMNYIHNFNLYPVINTGQYLIMAYRTFSYVGGAHGIEGDRYYNYSKQKQQWLQLEDVFDLSQKAAIEKALDEELRRQYDIPPGIKLSEAKGSDFIADKIRLTDNFTLSKFNITFHYRPYELTPYAMGPFALSVPYENFKGLFNKKFHD